MARLLTLATAIGLIGASYALSHSSGGIGLLILQACLLVAGAALAFLAVTTTTLTRTQRAKYRDYLEQDVEASRLARFSLFARLGSFAIMAGSLLAIFLPAGFIRSGARVDIMLAGVGLGLAIRACADAWFGSRARGLFLRSDSSAK